VSLTTARGLTVCYWEPISLSKAAACWETVVFPLTIVIFDLAYFRPKNERVQVYDCLSRQFVGAQKRIFFYIFLFKKRICGSSFAFML